MTLAQQITLWARGLSDPDAALVARAIQGSRSAFDTLVRRYEKPLRGFLIRRVGPDAADDVLQETLIACWTGLSKYAGRSRFKAWLFGIATHKCADHYRTSGPSASRETEIPPDLPDRFNAYQAVDLRESVQGVLNRLPEVQREILELYYYAELTLPEIAAALDRNLNTVKYQFYRAHALAESELRCQELQST